jgi:hypothetical protein
MTIKTLRARASASVGQHYVTLFSVMQGVVLAIAAFVLPDILLHRDWTRLLLWCVGVEGAVLTTHANAVGNLLLEGLPRLRDSLVPILLSIAHFLMFAFLQSSATMTYWNCAYGAFALAAFFLISGIVKRLGNVEHALEVRVLIATYIAGQRAGRLAALGHAVLFFGLFFAILIFPLLQQFEWRFGIIAALLLLIPIWHNREAGRLIDNFIDESSSSGAE